MANISLPLVGYLGNEKLIERFLGKVNKTNDCWNWIAAKKRSSPRSDVYYGVINTDVCVTQAHRFAFALFKCDVPAGALVLHSCDNGLCVNPAHLRLGTHKDNSRDMVARKRNVENRVLGSAKKGSKLVERDIQTIRQYLAAGIDWYTIGYWYNVSHTAIYQIARGVTWKHVP